MKPHTVIGSALVALTCLLGACSGGAGHAPHTSESSTQWLAVARGKVDVQGGMAEVTARTAAEAALDGARQQLAQAQWHLDATAVRSPVDGTVVTRNVAIGQAVSPDSSHPLFTVLPARAHIVRAQVDARAAAHLHAGMQAKVVRDSGAGAVYDAKVLRVGKVLRSATFTKGALARALANDVDLTLKLARPRKGTAPLPIGQRVLVKIPHQ
jgi:multidrug resistance efflux pump